MVSNVFFLWSKHQGMNPGPFPCKATPLPLAYLKSTPSNFCVNCTKQFCMSIHVLCSVIYLLGSSLKGLQTIVPSKHLLELITLLHLLCLEDLRPCMLLGVFHMLLFHLPNMEEHSQPFAITGIGTIMTLKQHWFICYSQYYKQAVIVLFMFTHSGNVSFCM